MSSRRPADVRRSLEELARHGGLVGPHKDGWGVAYYDGDDARLVREAAPAATSAGLRSLQDHPFTATTVISHIRKATQGAVRVENTQPFVRAIDGHAHVFAHNGDLTGLTDPPDHAFHPDGDTDSERAFCTLLERVRAPWRDAGGVPPLAERLAVIVAFAAELRALGPANFVYSDGDAVFVHAHRRNQGDGRGLRPPGLHLLCRTCAGEQEVVVVASVPLTGEAWQPLDEGEVVVLAAGERIARAAADGTITRLA